MNYNFVTLRNEIASLVELVRVGTSTLEDARRRLNEPIEAERLKMLGEVESYRQEIERRLSLIVESKLGAEAKLAVEQLGREKSKGFPWLATAYDDYLCLKDMAIENYLRYKPHPAAKTASEYSQISKERREAVKAAKLSKYLIDYCRFLAPWLDEYIGMDAEELDRTINDIHSSWEKREEEFDEEVKRQTGPSKWEALTPTQRLQRKLDWYWGKPNKTNWQIGRDYERYIGYLYEQNSWDVYYHGKKGYEDLGRDLVCKKGKSVEIVQCKYWSKDRTIHEKHVYYLFGTTVEYFLDNLGDEGSVKQLALLPDLVRMRNVVPKLIITTEVSPKATQVAKVLGIVIENIPFQRYPSIKCNVSRKNGEQIFHLPFDQQYDTILVEEERQERYVETVAEAESLGFRHAYRWKGETTE